MKCLRHQLLLLSGLALACLLAPTASADPPASSLEIVRAMIDPAPPVRRRFIGLDRFQAAHQGNRSVAADTSIAASQTRVLEAAGSALRLSAPNGSEAIVKSLNDFFGVPNESLLFQPKVYYDRLSNRFYAAALNVDLENRKSAIFFAFTTDFAAKADLDAKQTDEDTAASWCTYRFDVAFGAGAPAFAGSLALGQNESWIVLSTDNFRYRDEGFRQATVQAIDKVSLSVFTTSFCPDLSTTRISVPRDAAGERAFALQPAQHYTNSLDVGRPLYLVSTRTLAAASNVYTLWTLQGSDVDSLSVTPSELRGDFTYTQPLAAPQKGGPDLDTGDTRITQAAYRDGIVWAVHATGCRVGKPPDENCLRLVAIRPGTSTANNTGTANSTGAELVHQENLGRRNLFLWAPGVATNSRGDVMASFQRSQANQFLATGYVVRRGSKGTFDAMKSLSGGRCALTRRGSQGDVLTTLAAGAQTDPSDNFGFWVAGEYSARPAGGGCDWLTRVGLARDNEPEPTVPIELGSGLFTVPSAQTSVQVDFNSPAPETDPGATAGRFLVLSLRDQGRPNATCLSDHPADSGCATIDYPFSTNSNNDASWVLVNLGGTPQRLYLAESRDLSFLPEPRKPG